jgi:hypothetical protein
VSWSVSSEEHTHTPTHTEMPGWWNW